MDLSYIVKAAPAETSTEKQEAQTHEILQVSLAPFFLKKMFSSKVLNIWSPCVLVYRFWIHSETGETLLMLWI